MTDRLYRSPTDRVIAGVAGGLAVWLKIDPSLVRIAWMFLAIFSGGIFLIVYLVMMIVVPLAPPGWVPTPPPGPGGAPGGWQGPGGPARRCGAPVRVPPAPPAGRRPRRAAAGRPARGARPARIRGAAAGGAPGGAPGGWTPSSSGWSSAPPSNQGWSWGERERGNAGIVAGVILVGLGIWFLIDQYVDIDWRLLWPAIVIVVGAALIAAAVRRGRGQA